MAAAYVPAAVFTAWTIQRDRAEALEEVGVRIQRVLNEASRDNDAAIAAGKRLVATWTEVPELVGGTREQCERAFARLLRFAPFVASPTRITRDGYVDCGGRSAASIGLFVGNNPLFRSVVQNDTIALGPYLAADSTRMALLPLNAPLRDAAGRPRGMLSIGVKLDWLDRIARNAELPPGTIATVADSTGRLLARIPQSSQVGAVVPGLSAFFEADRKSGSAREGITVRNTLGGGAWLVAHRQLQSASGTFVRVAIATPPEVAYAGANARARASVALLVGTAMVALLIAWFGAQLLVLRDVDAILTATRRLGAGDLSARTGIDELRGEIGLLAQSFDTMASQLEVRQERMRHAERLESLGRLAGGVAHDFNNMLTAIVSSADLALDELPDDHMARTDLVSIKSAATRSSSLTRQLLDFSRRSPLVTTPVPLDKLVEQSATLLARVVPATVSVHVETNSTRLVRADTGRIEQALVNLTVNARDAMASGGVITIGLEDVDVHPDDPDALHVASGPWVRLRVSDTGAGMTADVLARIFEPFFTTKPVGEGTGLGLAMVYGTVQHHNGHIHVDSRVGVGTVVTIWFPVAIAEAPDEPALAAVASIVRTGVRIIVAEDQPEVRQLVARVLSRAGYEVRAVDNGADAIAEAMAFGDSLGVLITDYDMPGCRGDAVARALRARHPELPLVLMSGFASEGWPTDLATSPNTIVVEKPFAARQLLESVSQLLSQVVHS